MNDKTEMIRRKTDSELEPAYELLEKFGIELITEELRYFAADIIAENYAGKYSEGIACACQCYFNSRLLHMSQNRISDEQILLGDYFTCRIAGCELPEDSFRILEILADHTEKEIEEIYDDPDKPFDPENYRGLFERIAGVLNE